MSKFFLPLIASVMLLTPSVWAAETTCDCYCSVEGSGAFYAGNVTASNCQTTCTAAKYPFLVCATDSSQLPGKNPRCFDSDTCTRQGGTWDVSRQPGECVPNQRYCYPTPTPTTLAVSIAGVTSVLDIGHYVELAYRYLLGIGMAIAIVYIMIGGLQYVLSAGTGDVTKAKERVKGAVIGMVLLLMSYLILFTVNPNLVKLQVPQFPMVKRVELVSQGTSCEILSAALPVGFGYTITEPSDGPYGKEKCGSTAKVTKDEEGNDIAAGTTCDYETCPTSGTGCVGSGATAKCTKCEEVIPNNTMGITPSSSVCSQLGLPDVRDGNGKLEKRQTCFSTSDLNIGFYYEGRLFGGTSSTTCAMMTLDCTKLDACCDYDDIPITRKLSDGTLYATELDVVDSGDLTLNSICGDDPCGKRPTNQSCQAKYGTTTLGPLGTLPAVYDCKNSEAWAGGASVCPLF